MKKKLLSLLLCLVMALSLMPTVAFAADTEIKSVNVTGITQPVAGQTVAENIASISVASDAKYTVEMVDWWYSKTGSGWLFMSSSDTFNESYLYKIRIYLEPQAGYTFLFGETGSGTWLTYNGNSVTTSELSYDHFSVHGNTEMQTYGDLTIFGTAIQAVAAYDLWVDGVQVTSANKGNILRDSGTPTATYDPDTETLTLNGYNGGSIRTNIPDKTLNIVLAEGTTNKITVPEPEGDESVTALHFDNGSCTLSGKGNLIIDNKNSNGIHLGDGYLTVDMEGDLTVNAKQGGLYANNGISLCGSGNVSITGSGGIGAAALNISGSGDLTIKSSSAGITTYYGNPGDVTLSGSGEVSIKSGSVAVQLYDPDGKVLLNGTGSPITFTAGTGCKAVRNNKGESPVEGKNIANYDRTGAPDTASVVYTLKSGTPIKITEVEITNVPTPVAGASTAISASDVTITTVPADAADVLTIRWYNMTDAFTEDSTFKAGKEYVLGIHFQPKDGYYFEFDETLHDYTGEATFNGEEPNIAWSAYSNVTHAYTDLYTRCKPITPTDIGEPPLPVKITEVHVTGMPTPVAGASTAISADDITITTVPADAKYTVEDISWYNGYTSSYTDTTFEADRQYSLTVKISPEDGYYFEFDDTQREDYTGTATFNDEAARLAWSAATGSATLYIGSKFITPTAAPTEPVKITKVAVTGMPTTITVGASTAISASDVTITTEPADAADVLTICWKNETDDFTEDSTFKAGKEYVLGIHFQPKDGYYFEFDDTQREDYTGTATFNGEEPDIAWSVYSDVTHAYTDLYTRCKPITPTDIGEPPLPVKITEIVITDADITPVLGEKAGDHLAYTLPADCHYAATMNGWWDIFGSRIMDSDDVFEAGGLYCASWNFVADDGYAFASDATVTINGSTENVDTEHSYLDTTGNEPLFIISAKGVLVEAATYTVTFNANGGSVTPTSAVTGTDGKLVSLPTPTRSGSYRFDGWYTAANGGTKVTVDNVYTADTTIYAHWTYTGGGVTYYTLTFNTNGGSAISSVSGTYGKVIDLDKYVPTKSGYDFGGWYSDSALTAPVDEIKLNGNKTVYAKWIEKSAVFPFTDVKETDWSYDDIYYVWEKGLMQGTSETTFAPKTNTSRAMIVTILWRLEGEPVVNYAMSFDDVADGQWYTEAIRWAQANNIVNGYSAEKFGPTDFITREQMAAIFYRYAEFKGYDVSAKADLSKFADSDKISGWALDAIAWANAKGLVTGTSATTLSPKGSATREQVAAILHRFCENIVK